MAVSINQVKAGVTIADPSLLNKRTMVVIGDSWAAAEEHATSTNSAARGIFRNINMRLGNYFEIVSFAGTGGETIAQVLARLSADVLSLAPGYVGIPGLGVNDLIAGRTAAQMFADMQTLIDTCVSHKIIPLIMPCQLTEAGFTTTAANAAAVNSRIDECTKYNRALLEYSTIKSGWLYLANAWRGITDQAFTDGTHSVYMPAILSVYQFDTGHLNHAGAFRVAKDVCATDLSGRFPAIDMFPRHDSDLGSACNNPMMKASGTPHAAGVAGGTGITGTPPEGWYARIRNAGTGACTVSQVARTDVAGAYWSRHACTNLQSNQYIEARESEGAAFTYNYHLFDDYDIVAGDVVEFYAEVKIHSISDGAAGNGEFNMFNMNIQTVTSANAAVSFLSANNNPGTTSDVYQASDFSDEILVISTPRYTVGATDAKWYCILNAYAQNGAVGDTDFTFDIGRIAVRKVS